MNILYLLLLLNIHYCTSGNVVNHLFTPTETSPIVLDWNIELNDDIEFYIKEKIDSTNRVVELKFYKGENLYDIWSMYGVPIIRYKYLNNQIFEYYYDLDDNILTYNESESPFCRIYSLNEKNEIIECELVYYTGNSKIKHLSYDDNAFTRKEKENANYVIFYLYSSYKMNKVFPKAKNYVFDKGILEQVYDEKLMKEFNY